MICSDPFHFNETSVWKCQGHFVLCEGVEQPQSPGLSPVRQQAGAGLSNSTDFCFVIWRCLLFDIVSAFLQIASGEGPSLGVVPAQGDLKAAFFPAESLGRTSIGPVSESEEEEDEEEDKGCVGVAEEGVQNVFERDCTELDLDLIEEN